MNQETNDLLEPNNEPVKLPSGLNVLTILTYVGCGLGALLTLLTPVIINFFMGFMDKALKSASELSEKQVAEIEKGKAAMEIAKQYMIPNMVIGIIGVILCFVGAMWMRKLKKDGYWIYIAGELLPVIAGFALMGTSQFTGVMSYVLAIGIPVLFVILYTLQRKHLVK